MICLLPVHPSRDRKRFREWVNSYRVERWWGDPRARLEQFDATPEQSHALIAKNEEPVGYVRWELVERDALEKIGLTNVPDGSVDMDILIGDPVRAGRGAGPQALRLVFEKLRRTTNVPFIGLCTSVDNDIAHRAFEKAGCIRWARYDDDLFGPCWVYARWLRPRDYDGDHGRI